MRDLRDPVELGRELLALRRAADAPRTSAPTTRRPRPTLAALADQHRHALEAITDFDDHRDGPMCGLPPKGAR